MAIDKLKELQDEMYNFHDVGVAMSVQNAVNSLIGEGELNAETKINQLNLEKIRQRIYEQARNTVQADPMQMLLQVMLSQRTNTRGNGGNPTEGALRYIEDLQRAKADGSK